jgi:hypothetical protein
VLPEPCGLRGSLGCHSRSRPEPDPPLLDSAGVTFCSGTGEPEDEAHALVREAAASSEPPFPRPSDTSRENRAPISTSPSWSVQAGIAANGDAVGWRALRHSQNPCGLTPRRSTSSSVPQWTVQAEGMSDNVRRGTLRALRLGFPWTSPPSHVAHGAIGALAVVEFLISFFVFFSLTPALALLAFDDEGYLLVMFREWVRGGRLYDDVYSQYGPFHTLAFGLPLRLFHLQLTFTVGRLIAMALYVAVTVLLAIATLALTSSIWSALLVQVVSFIMLWVLGIAPMHPGAALMFLLSAALANVAVLRPRCPKVSDWLTGVILAGVVLTKINIGIILGTAILYTGASSWPADRRRRWLLPIAELALVAMGPVLLLSSVPAIRDRGVDMTSRPYPTELVWWSVAYVVAAVDLIILSRLQEPHWQEGASQISLGRVAAGLAVTGTLTVGTILVDGTSVSALVTNVLIRPHGITQALVLLPRMTSGTLPVVIVLSALVFCGRMFVDAPASERSRTLSGTLRIAAAGLTIVNAVPSVAGYMSSLGFTLPGGSYGYIPLTALVVLPRIGRRQATEVNARRFLGALAVGHTLHAFPVNGTQGVFSLVYAAVGGVVILDDGWKELNEAALDRGRVTGQRVLGAISVAALLAVLIWSGAGLFRAFVDQYRSGEPLGLPGTAGIRVPPAAGSVIRRRTAELALCSEFVSLPGLNSYYVLTGHPPPTGYNTVLWPSLLNDAEQGAIVRVLREAPDPVCFLVESGDFLAANGRLRSTKRPLERYLDQNFTTRDRGPGYELRVRRAS